MKIDFDCYREDCVSNKSLRERISKAVITGIGRRRNETNIRLYNLPIWYSPVREIGESLIQGS